MDGLGVAKKAFNSFIEGFLYIWVSDRDNQAQHNLMAVKYLETIAKLACSIAGFPAVVGVLALATPTTN